jgi:hypothetical protein
MADESIAEGPFDDEEPEISWWQSPIRIRGWGFATDTSTMELWNGRPGLAIRFR